MIRGISGQRRPHSGRPVGLVALAVLVSALVTVLATGLSAWLRSTDGAMAAEAFTADGFKARQLQVHYSGVTDQSVPANAGLRLHDALPPAVAEVLRTPRHTVATQPGIPQTVPRSYIGATAYVTVVGAPGAMSLVEPVRGRLPKPGSPVRALPAEAAAEYDGPARVHLVEVTLHERAADVLGIRVGSIVDVNPVRYGGPGNLRPTLLKVVGTYRATGAERSLLDDADFVRKPVVIEFPDMFVVRAAALAADDLTVLGADWSSSPEVRFTFDPARLPAPEDADVLAVQARTLAVQPWPDVVRSESEAAVTGLGRLASSYLDQRAVSGDVLALLVACAGWTAVVALWSLAVVLARRRRHVTRLLRARGASTPRMVGRATREALLLVLPGAALAALLVVLPAVSRTDLAVGVGVAVLCSLVLVAGQLAATATLPPRVVAPLRDGVHGALVLVAAVVAAWTWRSSVPPPRAVLVVLPLLLALATAVLAVRASALVGRLLRARRGGRTLAAWLAARHLIGSVRHALVPMTALVLATCAVVLPLTVSDTMRRGADRLATAEVGADVQLVGQFDSAAVRSLEQVPGVERVVTLHEVQGVLEASTGRTAVRLLAVGPEQNALAGPATDLLRRDHGEALGAVVSQDLTLADEATLTYAQTDLRVHEVGRAATVAGVDEVGSFVLVDAERLRAMTDRRLLRADRLLVSGTADPEAVLARARVHWPPARATAWSDVRADRLESGVAERTRSVAWGVAASATLAGLGAVLVLVARDHALRSWAGSVLTALGTGHRLRRRFESLAVGGVLGLAALTSVLTAALLVLLLRPAVDARLLIGEPDVRELALSPSSATVWGLVAVALVAVLVGAVTPRSGSAPGATPQLTDYEEAS